MNINSISNLTFTNPQPLSSVSQEVKELLLKYDIIGLNINAVDTKGQTAIAKATIAGDEQTVRLLIKEGADIKVKDNLGHNILDLAVLNGKVNVAQVLLESGFSIWDLNYKFRDSSHALLNSNYAMHMLFIKHGFPHRCT